jgi:hypothetical protein
VIAISRSLASLQPKVSLEFRNRILFDKMISNQYNGGGLFLSYHLHPKHMAIHSTKFLKKLDHLVEQMDRKDAAVINIDIIFVTLLVVHFWPELGQVGR